MSSTEKLPSLVAITIVLLSLLLFGVVYLLDRLILAWQYKKMDEYEDM
jgi:NADH:ubiquinone oxidoreductase subunit 3 (subunit A)